MDEPLPEPDRLEGAPHPRHTARVHGHGAAEAAFLEAFNSDRLHHAWLISGPQGIGKATLAWRLARFLLATPADDGGMFAPPKPDTLDIAPDHPIARRVAALSEPGLFLLRRPWDDKTKKLKSEITVDEARKLKGFFAMSVPGGGRRVVIIDAADQMNPSAANAVLKVLEEPPVRTTMLLVCHRPARLLPTIRSRCRPLRLSPLGAKDLGAALEDAESDLPADVGALAELAAGAPGAAITLIEGEGLTRYADLVQVLTSLPDLNRPAALAFAARAAGRQGDGTLGQTLDLLDLFLARLARAGAGRPPSVEAAKGELALIARLCPTPEAARQWASAQAELSARARQGLAVNLDPQGLLLDMLLKLSDAAQRLPA